jgi:gliding motility-associated-like protein
MDNVGEVAIKTDSSSSLLLSQGFEQPNYEISPVILPITPPNAFSPDNDGTNDTWILPMNDEYAQNKVVIFNRWGEIIRTFENYNNFDVVWDGSNMNNQQVVSGTYFYVIEVPTSNISISGWVQVVR